MDNDEYSWIGGLVIIGLIMWGGYSLFGPDDSQNTKKSYGSESNYEYKSEKYSESEDGYIWAEENDISLFDDCQGQFGTGYEEDECNRYVKENYSGYDSFNGYECTEDCGGHEAGYNWAEENGISSEYDCDGNSNSFNEGCVSYVEENY